MLNTYRARVEHLHTAEMFAICAGRVYRSLREGTAPPYLCLSRMFEAASIPGALPAFMAFQAALSADPYRSFVAEDRCLASVGSSELQLLQAIADWQHKSVDEATEDPLAFVTSPTVRRVAAPAGKSYALELASA